MTIREPAISDRCYAGSILEWLGSIVYLLFCTTRYGWGWDNFIAEADAGQGLKFPHALRGYLVYVVPAIMLVIFAFGYYEKFFK